MDNQQPSSGDLKYIQREHESTDKSHSLLQRRQTNKALQQQNQQGKMLGEISPMPTSTKRMAALRDLGATFEEGKRSIAKVATPTETVVPSFVDSEHLEVRIIQCKDKLMMVLINLSIRKCCIKKENSSLSDACDKSVVH
jgi:hypothetical protein